MVFFYPKNVFIQPITFFYLFCFIPHFQRVNDSGFYSSLRNDLSSLHMFVHHCTFCVSVHVKTSPGINSWEYWREWAPLPY